MSETEIKKPQILRLTDMTHHMRMEYHRVFSQEANQDEIFSYIH